jgi:hypothetical protein
MAITTCYLVDASVFQRLYFKRKWLKMGDFDGRMMLLRMDSLLCLLAWK